MAEKTEISWTDHTWSPWEGCTKVSPGCDHCYAEGMNRWLRKGANWGPGAPRREYSDGHWAKPLKWNAAAKAAGERRRVFPSVCDPFDNAVAPEWRARFFDLIDRTPSLDWLLLTKRIGNAALMLPWMPEGGVNSLMASSELWPNVWLGATIVNQEEADRDILKLLAIPARVRFLSMEPLLGPVDLRSVCHGLADEIDSLNRNPGRALRKPQVDWVIVGGESGPGARAMHPDWARSLRDQCAAAGVPLHFKQWGEWAPSTPEQAAGNPRSGWRMLRGHPGVARAEELYPSAGAAFVEHVGKKAAGRLLDGVEHNGFPEVR